jgi:hypothetical protein
VATVIERINLSCEAGLATSSSARATPTESGWLGQAQTSLRHLASMEAASTRARNLMRLGLSEERACKSAFNGRGHGGIREHHI